MRAPLEWPLTPGGWVDSPVPRWPGPFELAAELRDVDPVEGWEPLATWTLDPTKLRHPTGDDVARAAHLGDVGDVIGMLVPLGSKVVLAVAMVGTSEPGDLSAELERAARALRRSETPLSLVTEDRADVLEGLAWWVRGHKREAWVHWLAAGKVPKGWSRNLCAADIVEMRAAHGGEL